MAYEIIPQAPNYEINECGRLRNRKTGRILKWLFTKTRSTRKTILRHEGANVVVTLPSLMWQLHGRLIHKKRPVQVVAECGYSKKFFDSIKQCAQFLASRTGKNFNGIRYKLSERKLNVYGWSIKYLA